MSLVGAHRPFNGHAVYFYFRFFKSLYFYSRFFFFIIRLNPKGNISI